MTFDRYGHLMPGSRDQTRRADGRIPGDFPEDFPMADPQAPEAAV
jgi:hypothetical protein